MKSSASKIKLTSFDDLFGSPVPETNVEPQIKDIPLEELHEFKEHPFKVLDDDRMREMVESVKQYGILTPAKVRVRPEGGYEIISGHRRKRASELAGLTTLPCMVADYSDEEATVIMVDANIQREDILPSEKARAYRMKYEALKHPGIKMEQTSLDYLGETSGESGKTVQRYLWLSNLTDELLELVDKKKLSIVQGVNISFLSVENQELLHRIMESNKISITVPQSVKLKETSKDGGLTEDKIFEIIFGVNGEKQEDKKLVLPSNKLSKYFGAEYSKKEIEEIIFKLLEDWKNN